MFYPGCVILLSFILRVRSTPYTYHPTYANTLENLELRYASIGLLFIEPAQPGKLRTSHSRVLWSDKKDQIGVGIIEMYIEMYCEIDTVNKTPLAKLSTEARHVPSKDGDSQPASQSIAQCSAFDALRLVCRRNIVFSPSVAALPRLYPSVALLHFPRFDDPTLPCLRPATLLLLPIPPNPNQSS